MVFSIRTSSVQVKEIPHQLWVLLQPPPHYDNGDNIDNDEDCPSVLSLYCASSGLCKMCALSYLVIMALWGRYLHPCVCGVLKLSKGMQFIYFHTTSMWQG